MAIDAATARFVALWDTAAVARRRPEVVATAFEADAATLLAGCTGPARGAAAAAVARLRRELGLDRPRCRPPPAAPRG